jgi:membrane-bound lytic murein transglycosylase D
MKSGVFNFIFSLFFILVLSSCQENSQKRDVHVEEEAKEIPSLFTLPKIPSKIIFCGEQIDLTDEDVREKLDREILVNAYFQSATVLSLKRSKRYFPQIEKIFKEEKVPEDLKYLTVIESGLSQAVSPVGAQGFWQFMPFTAKEFDLEISPEVDERLHIEKSTRAACQYLKKANASLNDWLLTAASYNRGVAGVRSDMNWQGTDHYFDTDMNSETGRYVYRLLAVKLLFENPELYGYDITKMELYQPFKTENVRIKKTIPSIAKWSLKKGFNFKIITKLNPWLKGNRLTIRKKHYTLLIPHSSQNLKPYKKYL